MRRFTACTFFYPLTLVSIIIIGGSQQSYAQSESTSRSPQLNQGQILKELLDEVRLLRVDLSRMSSNAYRAQLIFERMRVQQEQVNRLAIEQNKVNSEIRELQAARPGLQEKIEALEKKWQTGMIPDTEVKAAKDAMERLGKREQILMEREPQLTAELAAESGNLEALKARLDEIEREIISIGKNEGAKPVK